MGQGISRGEVETSAPIGNPRVWKKDEGLKVDEDEEVSVVEYHNVKPSGDFEEYVAKDETHVGLCLQRLLEQMEALKTFEEMDTIDPEEFAVDAVRCLQNVLEFMERLEICLIESWPSPRFRQEIEVFGVLDGLIYTLRDQAERDLFGLRFTVFQEVQGHILMRNLTDRFKLLQQARDLIRKMYRCTMSSETSEEEKKS